jgi:hypothetical protein
VIGYWSRRFIGPGCGEGRARAPPPEKVRQVGATTMVVGKASSRASWPSGVQAGRGGRAAAMKARAAPVRHWRSYGDHPLASARKSWTNLCGRSRRGFCGSCASAAERSG